LSYEARSSVKALLTHSCGYFYEQPTILFNCWHFRFSLHNCWVVTVKKFSRRWVELEQLFISALSLVQFYFSCNISKAADRR